MRLVVNNFFHFCDIFCAFSKKCCIFAKKVLIYNIRNTKGVYKMTIGERIKKRRIDIGLSADELAEATGKSRATIFRYENGDIASLPISVLEPIAKALRTTPGYLMGWDGKHVNTLFHSPNITKDTTTYRILGDIAAGYDLTAEENWEGEEIEIPNSYIKGSKDNYFVLRVKGDSMYPDYQDGDCVLIRKQSSLDHSGQIGAVLFDGDYATLKRVEYKQGEDWMKLIPINTSYAPKIIRNDELERCAVLGIPKLLIRDIF